MGFHIFTRPVSTAKDAVADFMRKANSAMETNTNGNFFQEGDQIRIKRTGKRGKVNATDGGVVYVVMDETNEAKIFSAAVDEDALIELFPT